MVGVFKKSNPKIKTVFFLIWLVFFSEKATAKSLIQNAVFSKDFLEIECFYELIFLTQHDDFLADNMLKKDISTKNSVEVWGEKSSLFKIAPIVPTDINLSNTSVIENNSLVGMFTTIATSSESSYTYTLVTGTGDEDNDKFTITGTNLSFISAPDYELPTDQGATANNNTYTIRVQTDNGTGGTYQKMFTITVVNSSESPGGVGGNLELWLKADLGVTTSSSSTVSNWFDQSGNGRTLTKNTTGTATLTSIGVNFNPIIDASGLNRSFGTSSFPREDWRTLIFVGKVPDTGDNFDGYLGTTSTISGGTSTGFRQREGNGNLGGPGGDLTSDTSDWTRASTYYFNGRGITSGIVPGANVFHIGGGAAVTNRSVNEFFIGGYESNRFYENTAQYAEVLMYSDVLSTIERHQIESYLAIKYGITLHTSVSSYVNSSGNSIFSYDGTYQTHVVGIGKDIGSSLDQRISKSIENDAIITVSTDANFSNTNTSHSAILTNGQYLIIAANGEAINQQNTEIQEGFTDRLTREWKVANTNNVGTVHLKFNGFDSSYVLLTDADGDFSTGVTNAGNLNANGEISVTLNNNSYFTIARENSPPTDINLSTTTIKENETNVGSLTTVDVNVSESYIYTLVSGIGDEDNGKFSIMGANLSFVTAPDFENPTDLGATPNNNTYALRIRTNDGSNTYEKAFVITVINSDVGEAHPGGVANGLQLWLRADAEVTASANKVSQWKDHSGNNNHAVQITSGRQPTLGNTGANFNSRIVFNGTTNFLDIPFNGGINADNITVFSVHSSSNGSGNSTLLASTSNIFPALGFEIFEGFLGSTDVYGFATGAGTTTPRYSTISNTAASVNFNKTEMVTVIGSTGSGNAQKHLYLDGNLAISSASSTFLKQTNVNFPTRIGANSRGTPATSYWDGDIIEQITYNRILSENERRSVESYLALKYGVTLNTSGSYLNSSGIAVFTYDGTYQHGVVGIGKDTSSSLDQRISKSEVNSTILTLSTDINFNTANSEHTDLLNNGQYFIVANNNGATTAQTTELQNGYSTRVTREWKVANTGNVSDIHLKFNGFNNSYVLLTDADGDFSSGVINAGTLNANGEISTTLNNNSYFTLAVVNNVPTALSLSNITIQENTVTVGTFSTTDANSGDSHTYTLVSGNGDHDNSKFSITNNVLSFSTAPNFENPTDLGDTTNNNTYTIRVETNDGNGGTLQETFIITVTNSVELANFTINTIPNVVIDENSTYTSTTPILSGDTPIGNVTYNLSGADAGSFTMNPMTGVVSMVPRDFENPVDANTDNVYEITIAAIDSDGNSDTEEWTVTVNNILEVSRFSANNVAVNEGDTPNQNTANITITIDAPAPIGNQRILYESVDITANGGTDYPVQNSFIDVTSGNTTANISIPITGDTTIESNETFRIDYKADLALDPGFSNAVSFWTPLAGANIANGGAYVFETNPETIYGGTNASNTVLEVDGESQGYQDINVIPGTTYTVTYNASRRIANGGSPATTTMAIRILDANNTGTEIARDDITRTNTTFNLTPGTFNFTAPSGVNRIRFQFETTNTAGVGMIVDNLSIVPVTVNFSSTVTITNDDFTINAIANVSIDENTAYTSVTPAITGTPIGTLTYTLGGVDAADFTINSSTGVVSMIARDFENPVDANTDNIYELTITATDSDGNNDTEDWTVTVQNTIEIAPGGIGTNLQLWLKANVGVTATAGNVSAWNDQSGNGNHATQTNGNRQPTLNSNGANFNPRLTFNGTSDFLDVPFNSNINDDNITVFTVHVSTDGSSHRSPITSRSSIPTLGFILYEMPDNAYSFWTATPRTDGTNPWDLITGSLPSFNRTEIIGLTTTSGTGNAQKFLYQNGSVVTSATNQTYLKQTNTSFPTRIGAGNTENPNGEFYWQGDIVEQIIYNRVLSVTERRRVESYLAIKYGITLDVSIANYVNGSGTNIFTYDGTYQTHVLGIGKDNASSLDQRISKSIHSGAILTIATDTNFNNANSSHTDGLTNGQYLIVSSNNGATTLQNTELPSGFSNRIGREWKVTNTGNIGTVHLKFDGFDNTYILLTDTDGDFSSGVTNVGVLNANGEIAVALTNNSYFTLAEANNAPTDITLSNTTVAENTTAVGSLTSTDVDTGQSHSYTLVSGVGDSDNGKFTIVGNTLSFNTAPDFENPTDIGDTANNNTYSMRVETNDGNGGTYQKSFVIMVTDVVETANFTINAIANVTINENTSYTSVTPGITGTPIGILTYTLGGVDAADFTIDTSTGVVSMIARNFENPVDDNTDNVYELMITATDSDGNTDNESWTVTVEDVMDTFPGGIGDNIQLWLKANAGVTATANNVSVWNDQSGNGNHAVQTNANRQPTLHVNGANFNPRLTFNGTSDFLDVPFSSSINDDNITVFTVHTSTDGNNHRSPITSRSSNPNLGFILYEMPDNTYSFWTGTPRVDGSNPWDLITSSTPSFNRTEILNFTGVTGTNTSQKHLYQDGNLITSATNQTFLKQTNTSFPLRVGAGETESVNGAFFWQGDIVEQIIYNRVLSTADRKRVESYLAIKYGITLHTGVNNYVSSAGTTIFSFDGTYEHHVVGIGKDLEATLDQRISKSIHTGAILTLSTDTDFSSVNTSHGDELTNGQYLIASSNNGSTTLQTTELQPGFTERVTREWKVTNTGNVETVHLKFEGFNNDYVLLTDADGDFTSGVSNMGSLNTNGEITVTLSNNTYFTLAKRVEVIISQVYHSNTGRVIEVTNISSGLLPANSLQLCLYNDQSGDLTGVTPSATYALSTVINAGATVLIKNTNSLTGINIINSPSEITNAGVTNFSGGNDVLVLSTTGDNTAWGNRVDAVQSIANTTSYVRIDMVEKGNVNYTESEWIAYVNDDLDPYRVLGSGGPERHPHAPLLSHVNSSIANTNSGLGYHKINGTIRESNAWSNGIPDRTRTVQINEDYNHSGANLLARTLSINNSSKLTVTDNVLIVSNAITLTGTNDEIRLAGVSQLIQTHTSNTQVSGNGKLYVDQNSDVASIYRYNYMGSPVNTSGETTYTFASVVKDGSIATSANSTPQDITIVSGFDGSNTNPISIAEHWIYTFGTNGAWTQQLSSGTIPQTDGFIFKGPGVAQNYTFVGTPKDGNLQTTVAANTSYLVGNPFASAISAKKFLEDNTGSTTGNLYFWEQHESANGETDRSGHNRGGYIGGYGVRNISMGLAANSPTNTANNNNGIAGLGEGVYKEPKEYIAIAQGFFVSGNGTGGAVVFNNSQREFKTEGSESIFFKAKKKKNANVLPIIKFGMDYTDVDGVALHRQIGISFLKTNSFAFDKGYDAPIFDLGDTDMYWEFPNDERKYVIAGVGEITNNLEVPLTIKIQSNSNVTIMIDEWNAIDREIYLVDKVANKEYLLNTEKVVLSLIAGEHKNRFVIRFKSKTLDVQDEVLNSEIGIYTDTDKEEIIIKNPHLAPINKIELYDLLGKKIRVWKVIERIKNLRLTTSLKNIEGVYIVKLIAEGETLSKKVYLGFR